MTTELAYSGPEVRTVPRDLRELLEQLRAKSRVLNIERAVLPEPDVASFCRAASELGDTTILFDNITGYKGKRLLVNLLASWANCALMSGLPSDLPIRELVDELCSRADRQPREPVLIDVGNAPSYECLDTSDVDLYRSLPLFRVNEHDGGFYLHKACVVSEDLVAGARHDRMKFGMYSLQVQGRDRLGVHLSGTDNLSLHVRIAEKPHRRLPVAVCLGVPPLAALVASAAIGYEATEYNLISALYQHPFELTRCVMSKLSVPAYAEYVLEGYIEPGLRCLAGPFTCNGGGLSEIKRQPQIVVTGIAHRRDPILDNTYVGKFWAEHDCLIGIAGTLRLHKQAKDSLPEIARSGTRAEGVHLRLGLCGGRWDEKRSVAGMSFQDGLPAENCLSAYKQEIGEAQRRQAQCRSQS
ncbi:MAG TPA: UbiD family decarboxylase [Candidatus Saccharimonadales bacterium]|nr:UbiD family decarboxylase [Candidatus Saccharimonadales bacterium]